MMLNPATPVKSFLGEWAKHEPARTGTDKHGRISEMRPSALYKMKCVKIGVFHDEPEPYGFARQFGQ